MAAKLIWHPHAREDLLIIYEFIGLDDPDAAERLFTNVENKANRLVHYPRMGTRRPDVRPAVRILREGLYLILYRTHPDTDDGPIKEVEIVPVIDAAANWRGHSKHSRKESRNNAALNPANSN